MKVDNSPNTASVQKKFDAQTRIEFESERIRYTLTDYSGSRTFYAPYETLVTENLPEFTVRSHWRRRFMLAPVALAVFAIAIPNRGVANVLSLAAVALFALFWLGDYFRLYAMTVTQIGMSPPAPGSMGHSIRIIKDKDHDAILAELMQRWRARMLALFGQINPQEDPEKEAAKFRWLRKRDVIDDEQLQNILATIGALNENARDDRPRSLN